MYIRELVAANAAPTTHSSAGSVRSAMRGASSAMRRHRTSTSPTACAEPRPPGFHNMRSLWAPVGRIVRGPMLRLLDVPRALEQRLRWGPAAPLQFGLDITDTVVPENNGAFKVEFDGSSATVRRGAARPLLRMPVAVLAQIHAGELTVPEAMRLGLATGEGDTTSVAALFQTDRRSGCWTSSRLASARAGFDPAASTPASTQGRRRAADVSPASSSASCSAFQPSSAHFTRTGNFATPARARRSPICLVPRRLGIAVHHLREPRAQLAAPPHRLSPSRAASSWRWTPARSSSHRRRTSRPR
jgi:hypothetical protein